MAYNPSNPNGQTSSLFSQPVVITYDQLPTASTGLHDAITNPTTSIIGNAMLGWNSSSWERIRTDTALSGTGSNNAIGGILAVGTGPGYAVRIDPSNLGTATNSSSSINVDGASSITLAISTTTTGTFIIEGTSDNINWNTPEAFDGNNDVWVSGQNITPVAGNRYQLLTQGYRQLRIRTTATLGATVAHNFTLTTAQGFLGGMDTGPAPHNFGYTTFHRDFSATTQQLTGSIYSGSVGRRFTITDLNISTGGTTAGVVAIFEGSASNSTYQANSITTPALFRGEFAPSTTSRPGIIKSFNVPYLARTTGSNLFISTSAAMTIYVQVNGYEILS